MYISASTILKMHKFKQNRIDFINRFKVQKQHAK